jgi:UDP-N-acetylglucosamine 2-epimerase (non-hydrolysing)
VNSSGALSLGGASMLKILNVVGARPNFMKIAPIAAEISRRSDRLSQVLVHTGQHYDEAMSGSFFRDLNLSPPDINLEVGSGSHAEQTARVMLAFEPVLTAVRPDWVVVVGDVNSTLATTLVAVKMGVKVAHVEAGLRSFDWTMPEEINRVVTDRLADLLLTPGSGADENLRAEGIDPSRVVRVGNVMIDTLFTQLESASGAVLDQLKLKPQSFAVVTLHRPSNVDDRDSLASILGALGDLAKMMPVVFPVHPRTRARLQEFGIPAEDGVRLLEPLGYREFLGLWSAARIVLTDSGGLQEETTALGIPCLTLRDNTERPVTISEGTNQLVGTDRGRIVDAAKAVLAGEVRPARVPELWDGRAAMRIVDALELRG